MKLPFASKKIAPSLPVHIVRETDHAAWLKKQKPALKALAENAGFEPEKKKTLITFSSNGEPDAVYALCKKGVDLYDLATTATDIKSQLSAATLEKLRFELETHSLNNTEIERALTGWGLAAYAFLPYKSKNDNAAPVLLWPEKVDKSRVEETLHAIYTLRDLINTPPNDMGPADLESAARALAKKFKATVNVITGEKLLDKNFPLIHAVGRAAAKGREPRLIELRWGKKTDPKIAIVGKGVSFDTGGLNIKPTEHMKLMKKDMGGAAHAIALAHLIMALGLRVNLRVLIPAVENSISGDAFRPSDVYKSRKGTFVENTNTDAEGRLILADALTYACEENPELVIDFATLTGSARAALGQEIPAMFATSDKTAEELKKLSFDIGDPLWPMPIYQGYTRHLKNSTGDLVNSADLPGDLVYSALFLHHFITEKQEWIHLDCFAWESSGRPGRAKGGMDTGLRAIFALLEKRYS